LGHRLEIGADSRDGLRPRIATVPQIEHKSRISDGISSETGGRRVTTAQKFFDFPEQIHVSFSL
jgi:hypothetical protein